MKGFGRVVPKVALDARVEAAALVAAARAEAEHIRADTEAARAESRRQGAEAGRAEGLAELAGLIAAARAEADERLEAARPVALTLAGKMAERIVGRAVDLSPEVMAELAGAAMDACRARGAELRLRVHPDDLPAVAASRDALAARVPGGSALTIVADEAVGRYGCVIETDHGRVDARLDAQLEALERALAGGARG